MHHRNRYRRSGRRAGKGVFFLMVVLGAFLLLGLVVMLLWNTILPPVLGVNPLSYGQSIGLLILSRILFGSWGPWAGPNKFKRAKHWKEKWKSMPEEERAKYRQAWKERRCGPQDGRNTQAKGEGPQEI